MNIVVINGPNLNMLGIREPDIYGKVSYDSLLEYIESYASEIGVDVDFYQSNHEGDLIDRIQEAYFDKADGIVINPGGYTHTSVALLDAVKATNLPTVEVHISEPNEREEFRKLSFIRSACVKTISGKGIVGYTEAIDFLKSYLESGVKNEG
jgi:3-dehydroquinate dehydratase-2